MKWLHSRLILTLFFTAQFSWAGAHLCVDLFDKKSVPGLYQASENPASAETIARVTRLADELIMINRELISTGDESRFLVAQKTEKVKSKFSEQETFADSNFSEYYFMVEFFAGDKVMKYRVPIRSNGHVAFLDRTWEYRVNNSTQVKHYKAVYFDNDKIKSVDQGELILKNLPENFEMSRSMSDAEKNRWAQGQPFGQSTHFGKRVHFMPNKTRFSAKVPNYTIHMPRSILIEFYQRGEIEINVYEYVSGMDLTDLKLNFEIVFIGDEAIRKLAPYMQAQLQSPPNPEPEL